ncbi:MAG: Rhodanese-like domain protein [uncultured Cytophagales bacterium]|uniref:Rhodanese-like domain protein n=1 Tax=uncultured Cytophagales bacterium TaxID=158755 RepID=A0A6J4K5D6_9SPHI|nr:MAG: Rhodanese-like domain protein [uncultured Cytophagales bacterium]
METQQFNIAGPESNVEWVGRKVTGAHNGTIAIKEGTLLFEDDRLAGGRFVIDTQSIKILDITDPATNAQFAGHLASDDFFSSEQYPEATFGITGAEPRGNGFYHVTGDLTIKGITHPVSFDAQVNRLGTLVTASGKITIDRTKFGIKFRSGNFFLHLGDNLIYNNFDLNVRLTAQAVAQTEAVAQTATLY